MDVLKKSKRLIICNGGSSIYHWEKHKKNQCMKHHNHVFSTKKKHEPTASLSLSNNVELC